MPKIELTDEEAAVVRAWVMRVYSVWLRGGPEQPAPKRQRRGKQVSKPSE